MVAGRPVLDDGSGRALAWEGAFNVRDLGGLPTAEGRTTRWGRIVRADALDDLTPAGWDAVVAHGVRTVIDLRNDDELPREPLARPASVTTVHVPLDGAEHRDFWDAWDSGPQFGTPLYYRPHLEQLPERSAAVLSATAGAEPGGVVVHCVGGRDRTGLVAMLLLHIAGVPPEEIAADYALSAERVTVRHVARGEPDDGPEVAAYLAGRGTSAPAVVEEAVRGLDVTRVLAAGGLDPTTVAALRDRLLRG